MNAFHRRYDAAKQTAATEASKAMAEKVHAKTLALYEDLLGKK